MNTVAPFLTKERLSKKIDHLKNDYEYGLNIFLLNIPLLYTIIYGTFNINIFLFSYLFTGLFQGCVTSLLYKICDSLYSTKTTDFNEWKKSTFYDNVTLNFDSAYLYAIGASVYGALTFIPSCIRWELKSITLYDACIQLCLLALLHDVFFTLTHYIIHKVPILRQSHIELHHKCPIDIASSRCTYSSSGLEALFRDLYTAFIPTFLMGYLGLTFNAYVWAPYYTMYTYWSLYIHTGHNIYHTLHHSKRSTRNYGIYYITDYLIGTLELV
jgi:sterol desaturase/sphingolipid hydroxylase (fatty acid hydroxylase superfamily)